MHKTGFEVIEAAYEEDMKYENSLGIFETLEEATKWIQENVENPVEENYEVFTREVILK
ncbi:hypothetical protein [Priestia taiwanensis]|uniref:Uncharacterized protein n=1 Tax=Priestia taiwanensis TaxID=1347902 RepID=A0A917ARA9_9BACI|nr:hypothetical protein [Priestia taiwanensis]MBM7362693.1 hypothetical protein [Priestia taiwanensis]GGE64296.1 hypothetical protein GCM10007140_13160 [Priestia taiwanensis]